MSFALNYSPDITKESKHFQFLRGLAHFQPSLKLSQPPKGDIDAVVTSLLSQLKHQYPTAGPAYWSNRCWALIYWQPVYLAVYAVHKHHSWISFNDFQLGFNNADLSGFYFSKSNWLNESDHIQITHSQITHNQKTHNQKTHNQKTHNQKTHTLVNQQTSALKLLLENYLDQLSNHIKINRINAWRLIADCILMVILALDDISNSDKLTFSNHWLTSLGLYDRNNKPFSQLKQIANSSLVLKRKSCCMHYLIEPNNPCVSCNKFSR